MLLLAETSMTLVLSLVVEWHEEEGENRENLVTSW
jgi:hypothetical protein